MVTINGGTISGGSRGVWIQDPSYDNSDEAAKLVVTSGASVNNVHFSVQTDCNVEISAAANAVGSVTSKAIPNGDILANVNGTYKLYDSVQDAFNEAGANGSVSLTHGVTLTSDVTVPNGVTVNLNGNTMFGANLVVPNGGSVNLTDSVGGGSATVNNAPVSGGNNVSVGADGTVSITPAATPGNPAPAAPVVENIYYIPATADNSNMALWSILALGLLTTAFVTRKKKAEN